MPTAKATRVKDNGQPDTCTKSGTGEVRAETSTGNTVATSIMFPDGSGSVEVKRFVLGSYQVIHAYTIEPWSGEE